MELKLVLSGGCYVITQEMVDRSNTFAFMHNRNSLHNLNGPACG
jgi:hypothetical protein